MSWFYKVEPKYKKCTKEELIEYLRKYPRKFHGDVFMGCVSYYDFSTAPYWPEALMIAQYNIEYGESDWRICTNAEEVFDSRIVNRWAKYENGKWIKTIDGKEIEENK